MSGRDWLSAMLPYMDRGNEERLNEAACCHIGRIIIIFQQI